MNNNINSNENEKTAPRSALEIATEYFLKGWQPIPVPTRSKNPNFPNWHVHRTTRLDELTSHFNGKPQNVSVLLGTASGGLTDVDLDSRWSVELTTYFLPDTGAIFGRASKKRSHISLLLPGSEDGKISVYRNDCRNSGDGNADCFSWVYSRMRRTDYLASIR